MSDQHWAIYALKDIRNALDDDRYDVAVCHIADAIDAILARDQQDFDVRADSRAHSGKTVRHRM